METNNSDSCVTVDDYDDTPVFTREASMGRLKKEVMGLIATPLGERIGDRTEDAAAYPSVRNPLVALMAPTERDGVRSYDSKSLTSTATQPEPLRICKLARFRVSLLLSNMFATVLEDVLTQIHLVAECNNQIRLYKTQGDMTSLRSAKYGVKDKQIPEAELEIKQLKALDGETSKLSKLVNDRIVCFEVLKNTYLSLALYRSYEPLIKHRVKVEECIDHRLFMIDEEARNKEQSHELRRRLRQQRNRIKSNVYETNLVIDRLTSDVENSTVFKSAENRYVDKWQVARSEQHAWKLNEKESKVTHAISLYRNKFDEEQRVHSELENLMKINICELLQKIEERMEKYEKDLESIELKITKVRFRHEKQLGIREEMEQRLADHQREIDIWVQFKADREKRRLYEEKMTNAAIAVQAWWRGLLVRLELGPYSRRMQRLLKKQAKKQVVKKVSESISKATLSTHGQT